MKKTILFSILTMISLCLLSATATALFECDDTVALKWTVGSATASKSEVSAGGTVSITVPISNTAQNTDYTCEISTGSTSTSKQVQPGRTEELTLQVTAPSSETTSQKTQTVSVYVECVGIWDRVWPLADCNVYGDLTRTTSYKWPTQADIIEQQAESSASISISNARTLISSAQSAIADAQNKIKEANSLGADIGTAQTYLNQANADKSSADTYVSSAQTAYNSGNYDSASSSAQNAQSKADSAKSQANSAKSMVTQIIEQWNKQKNEASVAVTNARSEIDTSKQRVQDGEKTINDATVLGLDTVQAKADTATARSKLESAENYYAEASSAFDINNFEDAKSKANLAIKYANDAEDLGTKALNQLESAMAVAGEAAKAVSSANTEISQMNEILAKMDYIIRSTEKRGIDLTETKNVVANAKSSVDAAEDSMSEAQNRISAGSFDQATNSAITARDKAASARNRLDTMSQTISVAVEDALDKAHVDMQAKIAAAEAEVKSAGETYGANANQIVTAQNNLASAKSSFSKIGSLITSVKSASGLMDLLDATDTAFKEIDNTDNNANLAIKEAKSAKTDLLKKAAVGGAAIAGAVGGGLLLWRRKKNKTLESGKKEKPSKKVDKKKKKIDKKALKEAKIKEEYKEKMAKLKAKK